MDIAGWWTALGIAFVALELAHAVTDRGTGLVRRRVATTKARAAYVLEAPGLGGGLAAGRAVTFARCLPLVGLSGLAMAFAAAIGLTIFPKYWDVAADADLYHVMNTPYYIGLATTYLSTIVLALSYLSARARRRATEAA